jgi:phosphoribosylformimino-5-aminoimidazole carboxamide ribotide isomerase
MQTSQIIPALDLIDGHVVRLHQGDYAQQTTYSDNPIEQFASYIQQGAQQLHLVDLTGAKDPSKRQTVLIGKIIAATQSKIQVGGGIRTEQDVADLLAMGANRVVIGSTAVTQPDMVQGWFNKYGAEKFVLALAAKAPSTLASIKASRKCAISPAPPEAISGTRQAWRTSFSCVKS